MSQSCENSIDLNWAKWTNIEQNSYNQDNQIGGKFI